jgi:DNA invertase Pin-like site-specific DNA recombinase
MNLGYARTSTIEQEAGLEAQQRDLKAAGVDKAYRHVRGFDTSCVKSSRR